MNITEKGALRNNETICSGLHEYQNNINKRLDSNDFVNIRPFLIGGNKKQTKKNINMKKIKYNKKYTYKKYTIKRKNKKYTIKRKNKKYTRNIKH